MRLSQDLLPIRTDVCTWSRELSVTLAGEGTVPTRDRVSLCGEDSHCSRPLLGDEPGDSGISVERRQPEEPQIAEILSAVGSEDQHRSHALCLRQW